MTLCNENFLSPSGFKLVVPGFSSIGFQCTTANVPGISMGGPTQATPYNDFQLTGDKLNYEDFNITFLINEDCQNYALIHNPKPKPHKTKNPDSIRKSGFFNVLYCA